MIVTDVPLADVTGRGAELMVCGLPEDKPVPNTAISIPGAKDCANDAEFPILVTPIPGAAAIPVALKTTWQQLRPAALAVTVFGPGFAPSVKLVEATPCESLTTEVADKLPPPTAVKLTVTPATGMLAELVTTNVSGIDRACPANPV